MKEEGLTYRIDPDDNNSACVYRGADRFPLARFEYWNRARGWELWWIDPEEALSIAELKQLGQIGEALTGVIPREEELPVTATFIDITKEK